MKDDIRAMLTRQAEWQKSRAGMSWADKLRASRSLRRSIQSLRKHATGKT